MSIRLKREMIPSEPASHLGVILGVSIPISLLIIAGIFVLVLYIRRKKRFQASAVQSSGCNSLRIVESYIKSLPKPHPNKHKQLQFEECTICLDEMKMLSNVVETQCSHRFHRECLDIWLSTNSSCPNCRRPLRIWGLLSVLIFNCIKLHLFLKFYW